MNTSYLSELYEELDFLQEELLKITDDINYTLTLISKLTEEQSDD